MARTQLSSWQIPQLEGSGTMKYIQLTKSTVSHTPNNIVRYELPFPDEVEGINIKTIKVSSDERIAFILRLMDGNTNDVIYESLEEIQYQYDNVDIPYKPQERKVYVEILNKGSLSTKFHIDIRGIEVK